jgi:hypothetical protein
MTFDLIRSDGAAPKAYKEERRAIRLLKSHGTAAGQGVSRARGKRVSQVTWDCSWSEGLAPEAAR